MDQSKTICHINIREWDKQKGLDQNAIEVSSIDELYQKILEVSKHKSVHSVSIEQTDEHQQKHTIVLEISNILHEKLKK